MIKARELHRKITRLSAIPLAFTTILTALGSTKSIHELDLNIIQLAQGNFGFIDLSWIYPELLALLTIGNIITGIALFGRPRRKDKN